MRYVDTDEAIRLHDMLHERQWADADEVFHRAFGPASSLAGIDVGHLREAMLMVRTYKASLSLDEEAELIAAAYDPASGPYPVRPNPGKPDASLPDWQFWLTAGIAFAIVVSMFLLAHPWTA